MENGVPNYLKGYLHVKKYPENLDEEFMITGSIRCPCGSEEFDIFREKEEQSVEMRNASKQISALIDKYKKECNSTEHLSIINRQDKYYIAKIDFKNSKESLLEDITELNKTIMNERLIPVLMEAVCTHCGKEILIFDSSVNGFNGLFDSSDMDYKKSFSKIKKSKCRKCGCSSSKIEVSISNTGKSDLMKEHDVLLKGHNWEDAFDWITVNLKCADCGRATKNYLDIETM